MNKLYVLVDKELNIGQQAVQSGHGLAAWLLDNRDTQTWNNSTLIYLQVRDIERWREKLDIMEMKYSYFIEPDIDDKLTALACYTDDEKIFRNLKLMGQ